MIAPTDEQIDLVEKIFQYFFDYYFKIPRPKENPNSTLFAKKYNTDRETAQFCIDTIASIGHEERILVGEEHGYGSWSIVRMDRIKCENFLRAGGFRNYFSEQIDVTPAPTSNIRLENNYGQIVTNQGTASNHNSYVNTVDVSKNEVEGTHKKIGSLEKIGSIAGIAAALIAVLTYFHVFHF